MTELRDTLRDAVFRGNLIEVKTVVTKENRINRIDEDSRTPLQHATIDGYTDIVSFLIAEGADVDHQDALGYSSLHYAAQAGNSEMVTMLIQAGAQVNSQDQHGNTPLWKAVFAHTDDDSIIRVLLGAKADPDLANAHGVAPRDLAESKGDEIF